MEVLVNRKTITFITTRKHTERFAYPLRHGYAVQWKFETKFADVLSSVTPKLI